MYVVENWRNMKDFVWTREPKDFTITDARVEIMRQPETDL